MQARERHWGQPWEDSMDQRRASQETGPAATNPEGEIMHVAAHIAIRRNKPANTLRFATGILALLLVALVFVSPAWAQQQTLLHGTIRDPLGSLVVGASVELLQDDKVIVASKTNHDGSFRFDVRASENYRIRVSAATFETTMTPIVYITASGRAALDITLKTQTLTQLITVTATGTPTPEAQTGASVNVLIADDFQYMTEVQDPLHLIPGLQVTQSGQMGGTTGLSIRGGSTDANKVLIDGVPANAIGGGVEFANIATVGIDSIEVLREPNSALYGSDALAGVVSLTSTRGTTPLPLFTYSGDAGNFHTYRNEVTAGTVFHQFDFYSAFARMDTANNVLNSEFHNATYAGNFGWTPNASNDARFTVRHIVVSGGQPNSIALYGIADDSVQKEQDNYYNAVWNGETTSKWHNQVRYGGLRQNGQFNNGGPVGISDGFGDTDGAVVTIKGANGYSVTGQALYYYGGSTPYIFLSRTRRDFVYAQTDYHLTPHFMALGAFKFENESGFSADQGSPKQAIQRGNYSYTLQLSGDVSRRLFYNAGTGLEENGLFGFAATPRASLAYYLFRPNGSGIFSGTKLHGSFGKGIKEPSIFQQNSSLYGALQLSSLSTVGVSPLGPEDSRTYDGGLEQELFAGHARIGITYFHNQFTNGVEYVSQTGLGLLNVPLSVRQQFPYGAYINSLAFRSEGVEFESEYNSGHHLSARGGYTYTDARVQHSYSSDALGPTFNNASNFSTIPIGVYSPLIGARPFRVAPHTGYFSLSYTRSKFHASLTGTLVGKRDDSDFLTDSYFGNSLLLPNRNLLGAYQRLELGGGYQLTHRINIYANIENLLSEHYFEAFGYPALPLTFRTGMTLNFGGENWKAN